MYRGVHENEDYCVFLDLAKKKKKKNTLLCMFLSNGLETVISQSNIFIIQTEILISEHIDASCGV